MSASQVALAGSKRPAKIGARRLYDADPSSQMEVTVSLRGPALPGADNMPAKAMSREEYEAKYSASAADAATVRIALEKYGLTVVETSLPSRSMRVAGPVSAMNAAFGAHLGIYRSADQGDFRGREGSIQIPSEIDGIVTGVFGLDERRVARRKLATTVTATTTTATKMKPLGPGDLAKRYGFPPSQGANQQIGIAEFGGGYFAEDLQAFCEKYNLPVANVTTVPVGISSLTLQQIQALPALERNNALDDSIEVNMDIQIVAGLCPKAEIFVYFAPFSQKGWVDLLNKVISGAPAKPVTLSVSWGAPEDSPDWSSSARTQINDRLQAVALLGINVCISSGDDGSGDEMTDGRAHVDFPGSSPFALSVGGTMLAGAGANPTEEVWWEAPGERTSKGGGAGGGGVSVCFNRPQWQTVKIKSLNNPSIDGRVVPDVAALAGPPLYDLIFMGRDFPNGGTSASTPLWASLIACINANLKADLQQRFLTPLLYENAKSGKPRGAIGCVDITIGQNASHPEPGVGYKAGPGFDAVSGWGTPNGAALLQVLQE
jgi:kumamolisin